jgi:type II secretory pathway component PulF
MNDTAPGSVPVSTILKVIRFGLGALPVIFCIQVILIVAAVPVFAAMFADFGARLPELTVITMNYGVIGLALAVVGAACAVYLCIKRELTKTTILSTALIGLAVFVMAQVMTLSLFLPIFQLGAVAGGLETTN